MVLSQQNIDAAKRGEAVRISADDVEMVVVRADVFDRVRKSADEDLTHDELRQILSRSFSSGDWADPQMDIYDEYDKHRK